MNVDDIALASLVRQERVKELLKSLAWIIYNGAALTGIAVNDPKKYPKPEVAFPELFERKEQQDWRIMKERVESFNKMRNKE